MVVSLVELREMIKSEERVLIIDVRRKEEFEERHIPIAINLPIEDLEAGIVMPDLKKTIVTVCGKGGGRSERAAKYIRENLNGDAYFLEGGTFGWFEE